MIKLQTVFREIAADLDNKKFKSCPQLQLLKQLPQDSKAFAKNPTTKWWH